MTKQIEFELTYLAREVPPQIKGVRPKRIVDIYVPEDVRHPHLRLRQNGDSYEITDKQPVSGNDSSEQTEDTIILDKAQFEALARASQRRVDKDRYKVKIDGHLAEVDIFRGTLAGLVLIDFEFQSAADKDTFTPPACCLVNVTQEELVAGGYLSGKSFSDIQEGLARYNYQKL